MSDPSEVREWTIYVCPRCGFMDPDQYDRSDPPRTCPFAWRGLKRDGKLLHPYRTDTGYDPDVTFVPVVVVPKEQDHS